MRRNEAGNQKALDVAAKQGGVVRLPAGKYLVAGSLKIPEGVAMVGSNQAPVYIEPLTGTVILATGGRDKEDAPALFEMGNSSTVQGLAIFYPDQKPDAIHPYTWTFHLQGGDNTVENVTASAASTRGSASNPDTQAPSAAPIAHIGEREPFRGHGRCPGRRPFARGSCGPG